MTEKGAIIHEPLVPRTFRLLAESEKEGNGLVTYGLKDPNDNTFTYWNGSILLDDGRFYELQLECDQNYPQKPPIDDGIYLCNLMYGFEIKEINFCSILSFHSFPPLKSHVSGLKQPRQWKWQP